MAFGQVTGARAIYALRLVQSYVGAKLPRLWFSERLQALKTKEFDPVVQELDLAAVQARDTAMDHEHTELFALRRDQRYATRSRRYLMLRGQQTKIDASYEVWRMFVAQNPDADLERFFTEDVKSLMEKPFSELMEPQT